MTQIPLEPNPLQQSIRLETIPEPCVMVIFGASGDLTRRKLLPAIFDLEEQGLLPAGFTIVGVGRTPMDDGSFRSYIHEEMQKSGHLNTRRASLWEEFAKMLHYVAVDANIADEFVRLRQELHAIDADHSGRSNYLFYLATPPSMYTPIIRHIGSSGMNHPRRDGAWVRIVIEKPFGVDLDSARDLNREVMAVFQEEQVYRIDHYLGKETVQNLLVFRFANGIFEPIWNRNYIDHVQITAAETVGVENRGAYYEEAGTLRDMIQNHMLQLLALTAMEPPVLFDERQVRDEKHKVLQAVKPFRPEDVQTFTVRGQYARGTIAGATVPAYKTEKGVAPDSVTETYVAVKFAVDNWRWADVPFYVRSGKRLPKRITEIAVQFKKTPHHMFSDLANDRLSSNSIVIRIQPDEGISLRFNSKIPGSKMRMRPVTMDFRYGAAFGGRLVEAYTRLLLDCMLGDPTLYARGDSLDIAWSLITPVLQGWKSNARSLVYPYPAGTWGPPEADALLQADGRRWRLP